MPRLAAEKTQACPKCSTPCVNHEDGTIPWHTLQGHSRLVCPAADRGLLIRALRAAGIGVTEQGSRLVLPNKTAFDPYTGKWWFRLGGGMVEVEGMGLVDSSLSIELRVSYLKEFCTVSTT